MTDIPAPTTTAAAPRWLGWAHPIAGLLLTAMVFALIFALLAYLSATLVSSVRDHDVIYSGRLRDGLYVGYLRSAGTDAILAAWVAAIPLLAIYRWRGWRRWWQFAVAGLLVGLLFGVYSVTRQDAADFHALVLRLARSDETLARSIVDAAAMLVAGLAGASTMLALWSMLRVPARITVPTAGVATGLILLLVGPLALRSDHFGRGRYASDPMEVDIGRYGYIIPRDYVEALHRDAYSALDGVQLTVSYPGLKPRTEANRRERNPRYRSRPKPFAWPEKGVIGIAIRRHGYDGYRDLQNAIRQGGWARLTANEPWIRAKYVAEKDVSPMVGEYEARWNTYRRKTYVSDIAALATPAGGPMVLDCETPYRSEARRKGIVLCEVVYRLADGAWLHYRFRSRGPDQWREIDTAVRALVQSFRKPG